MSVTGALVQPLAALQSQAPAKVLHLLMHSFNVFPEPKSVKPAPFLPGSKPAQSKEGVSFVFCDHSMVSPCDLAVKLWNSSSLPNETGD